MATVSTHFSRSHTLLCVMLLQFLIIALAPPLIFIGIGAYPGILLWDAVFNSMLINVFALFISIRAHQRFELHPQKHPAAYIIPVPLTVYPFAFALLLIIRAPYSVKALLMGLALTPIFLAMLHVLQRKHRQMRFLVVPLGEALKLTNSEHYKFRMLSKPVLPRASINGVVADFHSNVLTAEWERFLAHCALKFIPVYNVMQLKETMTGQVDVAHLAENSFGGLVPSRIQMTAKRCLDLLFLVLISPVVVPLMLSVALWIMFDSPGGPLFIQKRMGLNGQYFNVVKFRSMVVNHGGSHFTQADENDRITRVGQIIRKYRIDELPQFWNVLKGEMSLIGPRPESAELAKWYEKEVPFFAYRHVVRPGISGWAQVMHGYAAGVDEMKEKLSYDFYYIKHFSLWLDLLIWYKTIRTVLTGFGSR